jgi:hypothetical protein
MTTTLICSLCSRPLNSDDDVRSHNFSNCAYKRDLAPPHRVVWENLRTNKQIARHRNTMAGDEFHVRDVVGY